MYAIRSHLFAIPTTAIEYNLNHACRKLCGNKWQNVLNVSESYWWEESQKTKMKRELYHGCYAVSMQWAIGLSLSMSGRLSWLVHACERPAILGYIGRVWFRKIALTMVGEIFLEHVCVSGQVVLFFSPPIYRVDLVRTSLCLAVFLWPPRLKILITRH